MALSALDRKGTAPTSAELRSVLGPAYELWQDLVSRLDEAFGPLVEEWNYAGAKWGWSMRLKKKKRNIVYLTPQHGTFLAGMVLGDRALAALHREELSRATLALIDEAPRYAEGTGFRMPVTSTSDCSEIETILRAKLA